MYTTVVSRKFIELLLEKSNLNLIVFVFFLVHKLFLKIASFVTYDSRALSSYFILVYLVLHRKSFLFLVFVEMFILEVV